MTPAPTPSALARIQTLPSWLVGRVAARGRALVADALAAEGLKLAHHAVLAATDEYGPLAQADLGRRLAVDPKDLVGLLNHLQGEGLVLRTPDPADRRKNAISLTPAGADTLARCTALAEAANTEFLAPLEPAERDTLLALLGRIHDAA